jgi:hypothetical protein
MYKKTFEDLTIETENKRKLLREMEERLKQLQESVAEKEKVVEKYEQWMQNYNQEKETYRQSKIENAELTKEVGKSDQSD